jgi:hypothetical protein
MMSNIYSENEYELNLDQDELISNMFFSKNSFSYELFNDEILPITEEFILKDEPRILADEMTYEVEGRKTRSGTVKSESSSNKDIKSVLSDLGQVANIFSDFNKNVTVETRRRSKSSDFESTKENKIKKDFLENKNKKITKNENENLGRKKKRRAYSEEEFLETYKTKNNLAAKKCRDKKKAYYDNLEKEYKEKTEEIEKLKIKIKNLNNHKQPSMNIECFISFNNDDSYIKRDECCFNKLKNKIINIFPCELLSLENKYFNIKRITSLVELELKLNSFKKEEMM